MSSCAISLHNNIDEEAWCPLGKAHAFLSSTVLCCIIYFLLCVFNTSPLYHLRGFLDYLLTGTGPVNAKLSLNVDHERSKEGRPSRIFREA